MKILRPTMSVFIVFVLTIFNFTVPASGVDGLLHKPTNVQATISSTNLKVTWDAPTTGTNLFDEYQVRYSNDFGISWIIDNATGSTQSGITLRNLEKGDSYVIQVRAIHNADYSEWVTAGVDLSNQYKSTSLESVHRCNLLFDGNVSCSGYNYYGELGNGYQIIQSTPTFSLSSITASSISAGGDQTCSLNLGIAKCWGDNSYGERGIGSIETSYIATEISALTGIVEIANGESHTCARFLDGSLKCWGDSTFGRLGSAGGNSLLPATVLGVEDASFTDAIDVGAGRSHTCAVHQTGKVSCWGYNFHGQLGNSTGKNSSRPSLVSNIDNALSVAPAERHSCALLGDGTIKCWGSNTSGLLGDGSNKSSSTTPVTVSGITDAIQVSAGALHTCALHLSGKVSCWGNNFYGQLGQGDSGNTYRSTPVEVIGIENAIQISVNEYHTCALLNSTKVFCWGFNQHGQLGDNSVIDKYVPTEVPGLSNVNEIVLGNKHTCALLNNSKIKCWGSREWAQIGDGIGPIFEEESIIAGVSNAIDVATTSYSSCAVERSGSIKCWGSNTYGELGNESVPSSALPLEINDFNNAISVSGSGWHFCAITTLQTVKCWGMNFKGQLGSGNNLSTGTPSLVHDLSNVKQVSAGSEHTCALILNGQVKCWGENENGQLGNGTQIDSNIPVLVSGISDAVAIDVGNSHSCVLHTSGEVSCWGNDTGGALGNLASGSSRIPLKLTGISNAVQVSAGGNHTCALLSTGEILCWGSNNSGALGTGDKSSTQVPSTEVVGISNAVRIEAGGESTCALLETNEMKCWGANNYSLLGGNFNMENLLPITNYRSSLQVYSLPSSPSAPEYIEAGTVTRNSIQVSWSESDGFGYPIEKYKVEWRTGNNEWASQETQFTSTTISGLSAETQYVFRVSSYTVGGWSEAFASITVATNTSAGIPTAPTSVSVENRLVNSLKIAWSGDSYGDGLEIDHYRIEISSDEVNWQQFELIGLDHTFSNLNEASQYWFRVSAHSSAGWSEPSNPISGFTRGTRNIELSFTDSFGNPLTGGQVSWKLNDGTFASATEYGVPSSGKLIFPRVAAGFGSVSIQDAALEDGSKVSGTWQIALGGTSSILVLPEAPTVLSKIVKVTLPNDLPIPNAVVKISGLLPTAFKNGFSFKVSAITSGLSNVNGEFTSRGYTSSAITASATYNDGVLVQSKTSELVADLTTIQLEEMPWVYIAKTSRTASLNTLVSVTVLAQETAPLNARLAMDIAPLSLVGAKVKIEPPKGATQKCKGKILSSKINTENTAILKVCATKTGEYKLTGVGAVATSSLNLQVKGAPSTPVSHALGVSEKLNQANFSWGSPIYSGGAPIRNYVVELKGGGKTITKTVKTKSVTFTGLKNATTYTATIWAVTKNGKSDPVSVKVGVA